MSGAKRFKAQQNEEVGLNVPIEVGSLCPVCLQSVRPPRPRPPPHLWRPPRPPHESPWRADRDIPIIFL